MKVVVFSEHFAFLHKFTASQLGELLESSGLSLSFESPVALMFTTITNLFFSDQIHNCTATGKFICNTEVPSSILSRNRCYGLGPLMAALILETALRF